jgi:DEAD/DEAH box helicase domain-containing protein
VIVYDLEIKNAIATPGQPKVSGIKYCDGWHDHENMGISVLVAYDTKMCRFRLYGDHNLYEFDKVVEDPANWPLVSYNGLNFDNRVIDAAWGIRIDPGHCYDILREIWAAHGLGPNFDQATHNGFGLDATAKANGLGGKTGTGALAPVMWQQGRATEVIDYCLRDVWITSRITAIIENGLSLFSPKSGEALRLTVPQKQ